eukprot:snap_masked-scaffold_43-processed-gene-1.73-mRNA-1 protein AED:1.00 eAED:1.00 QI:0/0/0/0/1/1/2/0/571
MLETLSMFEDLSTRVFGFDEKVEIQKDKCDSQSQTKSLKKFSRGNQSIKNRTRKTQTKKEIKLTSRETKDFDTSIFKEFVFNALIESSFHKFDDAISENVSIQSVRPHGLQPWVETGNRQEIEETTEKLYNKFTYSSVICASMNSLGSLVAISVSSTRGKENDPVTATETDKPSGLFVCKDPEANLSYSSRKFICSNEITCCIFNEENPRILAAGCDSGKIHVWKINSSRRSNRGFSEDASCDFNIHSNLIYESELHAFSHNLKVTCLKWCNKHLMSSSLDGKLLIWKLADESDKINTSSLFPITGITLALSKAITSSKDIASRVFLPMSFDFIKPKQDLPSAVYCTTVCNSIIKCEIQNNPYLNVLDTSRFSDDAMDCLRWLGRKTCQSVMRHLLKTIAKDHTISIRDIYDSKIKQTKLFPCCILFHKRFQSCRFSGNMVLSNENYMICLNEEGQLIEIPLHDEKYTNMVTYSVPASKVSVLYLLPCSERIVLVGCTSGEIYIGSLIASCWKITLLEKMSYESIASLCGSCLRGHLRILVLCSGKQRRINILKYQLDSEGSWQKIKPSCA